MKNEKCNNRYIRINDVFGRVRNKYCIYTMGLLRYALWVLAFLVGVASFALLHKPVLAANEPIIWQPTGGEQYPIYYGIDRNDYYIYLDTFNATTTIDGFMLRINTTSTLPNFDIQGCDPNSAATTTYAFTQQTSIVSGVLTDYFFSGNASVGSGCQWTIHFSMSGQSQFLLDTSFIYPFVYVTGVDNLDRIAKKNPPNEGLGFITDQNGYYYKPVIKVFSSSTPSNWQNSISLDIPSSGQTLSDFNYWTVSAISSVPSSTLSVVYYDNLGAYYNDRHENFYSPELVSVNIPKNYALHNGSWQAKANLVSPNDGVIASSSWVYFVVTSATSSAPIGLSGCSATSTYSVWDMEGWWCVIRGTVRQVYDDFAGYGAREFEKIQNLVLKIFPLNILTHINRDFTEARNATSTQKDITLNSDNPKNFFYQANFHILTSSTVGKIYEDSSFNLRSFLTYLMYAVLGGIMIKGAVVIVHSTKNNV